MKKKILSIVIPIYNEEEFIKKLFNKIKNVRLENLDKEIIFVNDGSFDKSKTIIEEIVKNEKNVKLVNLNKNKGKGAAVKLGINFSKGNIVIIQDADLEYNPKNYSQLLKPILEKKYKIIYGKRNFSFNNFTLLSFFQYLANKFINFIFNFLFKTNINDIETGYKAFQGNLIRKIVKDIKTNDFVWEIEVTARLLKDNINIKEVDVDYNPRTYKQGKKITIIDFFKAIYAIFKFRLSL